MTTHKTAYGTRLAAGFLKEIRLLLFVIMALNMATVFAKSADYVVMDNARNMDLGTWTGLGGLATSQTLCVASADNDSRNPPASANKMPYQVKVDNSNAAGEFYVYLGGNSGAASNERIRVTFYHMDVVTGSSLAQLTEGSYDSHGHVGAFKGCQDGDNSQLRVEISAGELAGKVSGNYRGDFTKTARGGSSGAATDSSSFRVSVSVQASPEVQISRLDNIALGSHGGLGSIYAEENFCVFSSSGSGSYSLSVSSSNQDGSGNFYLAGPDQIPYDLYFAAQSSGPGTTKVSFGSLAGFGNSSDPACNGSNNATLSISITQQNLQQATSGSYSDALVILVAPQ